MREYLKNGYVLNYSGRSFSVTGIIGEGSSCIAYDAINLSTGDACIIKEYCPAFLSLHREENGALTCNDDQRKKFGDGKDLFNEVTRCQIEIRNMADPINHIFPVMDHFECNGTVYTAVPKLSGKTYADNQEIGLYDRIRICKSMTEYVSKCHALGFLCLDIKPANIFVLPETPELVMVFDFDSMRKMNDVQCGGHFSYTAEWAAPEQVVPGGFANISRATDIYALGELIYWSVFDCHSTETEHGRVSCFDYNRSVFRDDISDDAGRVLTKIFRKTIRSSHRNRYQSTDELLAELQLLVTEIMPKKIKLLNVMPTMATYFIGREDCLQAIEEKLHTKHVAVLTGLGGIGKSELAKQYVLGHKYDYKNIIFMTYSYDLQTMINETHFLSGCEQKDEESDEHYCERRVNMLHELLPENSLLVIDNLNVELEEINQKHIWKKLSSIACDLIVTSRCNQAMYEEEQIHVGELEYNRLVELFLHYCPLEGESLHYVSDLIEMVQRHTLVLELVARQVRFGIKTPEEMLKDLSGKGLLGLNENRVKWALENRTVADHVKTLFSMADMDDNKKSILFMMALMPVSGIDRKDFMAFFSIDNYETIRYLVDNGWVREKGEFLSVHPIIARVDICEISDKCMVNTYAKAIRILLSKSNDKPINNIGWSIALQTKAYGIECNAAADYLVRYSGLASRYGNKLERADLLLYSIEAYNKIYQIDKYVTTREYAYSCYAKCINDGKHIKKVNDMCNEHLAAAERNNDLYMMAVWHGIISGADVWLFHGVDNPQLENIMRLGILCSQISKEKKKSGLLSEEYLKKLHYGYMLSWKNSIARQTAIVLATCYENSVHEDVFYVDKIWEPLYLRLAINIRATYTKPNEYKADFNNIELHIDKSKILIVKKDYEEARKELKGIILYFETNKLPEITILVRVHKMLGEIALVLKAYDEAINEFSACMSLAKQLNMEKNYSVWILLARAYALSGKLEMASVCDKEISEDIESIDSDKKRLYEADVIFNEAIKHDVANEKDIAIRYLDKAQDAYKIAMHENSWLVDACVIGISRAIYRKASIQMDSSLEYGMLWLPYAIDNFKEIFGKKHIETKECIELFETYKRKSKYTN